MEVELTSELFIAAGVFTFNKEQQVKRSRQDTSKVSDD